MKKNLAIYDSDVFYVTRFLEYFKSKNDCEFDISAFTQRESLLAYLSERRIDILLLGKPVELGDTGEEKIGTIYRLSEELSSGKDKDPFEIYKYQRAQSLLDELREDYNRRLDKRQTERGSSNMEIITVFSPKAGIEDLLYAWSAAFLLAKRKRVLFLPMELIPSHSLPFLDSSLQNLSEFIYYLKENPNPMEKMKSLLSYQSNLCYLSGTAHSFDLLSLNREDICKWISGLRLHTEYEAVIFYLDYYDAAGAELMKLSDRILLSTDQSDYGSGIWKEWEEQMNRLGNTVEPERYQQIILRRGSGSVQTCCSLAELSESPSWHAASQYLRLS